MQTTRFGNVLNQAFRPQEEVVFSLQLVKRACDNYFATVAEHNIAQLELFHALGYPARELASSATPAPSCRWIRRGPASCLRWAPDRRRQPASVCMRILWSQGPVTPGREFRCSSTSSA